MQMIGRQFVERRLRGLLEELAGSPTARREMRYRPSEALRRRDWNVPAPPALPVILRRMAGFVWDTDAFFGDPAASNWASGGYPLSTDVLLFALGERPSALTHLPEEAAQRLLGHARSRGWAALIGPFAMMPLADRRRAGFADAADRFHPPLPGSGGYRAVVLARSADVAGLMWLSLLFGWDDYLGDLLGYPRCCTAAFSAAWSRVGSTSGDVAMSLADQGEGQLIRLFPSSNAFVRVLGAGLPIHFPCTLTCPATDRRVRRQLVVLEAVAPERAVVIEQLLTSPTLLARGGEVVTLLGGEVAESADSVSYRPDQLRCSDPSGELAAQVAAGRRFHLPAHPHVRLVLPQASLGADQLTGVVA